MMTPIYEEPGIKVYHDDHAPNPRNDFEYTSTLCIEGDRLEVDLRDCIWLPVFRYQHSAVAYNTTGFSCPWDSCQVGFIYETKESVRSEFGVKRISPQLKALIEDRLRAEVEIYSCWANGEVFGFETDDGESCWGFYGDWDYMLSEARDHVA